MMPHPFKSPNLKECNNKRKTHPKCIREVVEVFARTFVDQMDSRCISDAIALRTKPHKQMYVLPGMLRLAVSEYPDGSPVQKLQLLLII